MMWPKDLAAQPMCRPCRAARRVRPCLECGGPVTSKNKKRKWCSRDCYRAAKTVHPAPPPRVVRDCEWCAAEIPASAHLNRKYCSELCAQAGWGPKSSPLRWTECHCGQWFAQRGTALHCPNPNRKPKATPVRVCRGCGQERDRRGMYCTPCKAKQDEIWLAKVKAHSKEVRKAARRAGYGRQDTHRRRARRHGVAYDPSITRPKVLDRDNWVCWICGDSIPNIMWVPKAADLYGTIDHVQEMCLGGSHTWDNVRAAHHRCNWERSIGVRAA
jgi:hypothetical protein